MKFLLFLLMITEYSFSIGATGKTEEQRLKSLNLGIKMKKMRDATTALISKRCSDLKMTLEQYEKWVEEEWYDKTIPKTKADKKQHRRTKSRKYSLESRQRYKKNKEKILDEQKKGLTKEELDELDQLDDRIFGVDPLLPMS